MTIPRTTPTLTTARSGGATSHHHHNNNNNKKRQALSVTRQRYASNLWKEQIRRACRKRQAQLQQQQLTKQQQRAGGGGMYPIPSQGPNSSSLASVLVQELESRGIQVARSPPGQQPPHQHYDPFQPSLYEAPPPPTAPSHKDKRAMMMMMSGTLSDCSEDVPLWGNRLPEASPPPRPQRLSHHPPQQQQQPHRSSASAMSSMRDFSSYDDDDDLNYDGMEEDEPAWVQQPLEPQPAPQDRYFETMTEDDFLELLRLVEDDNDTDDKGSSREESTLLDEELEYLSSVEEAEMMAAAAAEQQLFYGSSHTNASQSTIHIDLETPLDPTMSPTSPPCPLCSHRCLWHPHTSSMAMMTSASSLHSWHNTSTSVWEAPPPSQQQHFASRSRPPMFASSPSFALQSGVDGSTTSSLSSSSCWSCTHCKFQLGWRAPDPTRPSPTTTPPWSSSTSSAWAASTSNSTAPPLPQLADLIWTRIPYRRWQTAQQLHADYCCSRLEFWYQPADEHTPSPLAPPWGMPQRHESSLGLAEEQEQDQQLASTELDESTPPSSLSSAHVWAVCDTCQTQMTLL